MKTPTLIVLLSSLALAHADDAVRSAAYRSGDEQAQIHSTSTELLAELDAIILEIERNGLSGKLKNAATTSREGLSSAREGSINEAVLKLREMSLSGKIDSAPEILKHQQEAEIALRRVANNLAVNQFTEQAAAVSAAIVLRQEKAIELAGTATDKAAVLAEQQAIALQVDDLVAALSSAPADLPPSVSTIIKQAADTAANLKLTTKAAAATTAKKNELQPMQQEVRSSLASIDQILAGLIPARDRLEQAAGDLKQMQNDLAALKSEKQSAPDRSKAIASEADATARQVASESPQATAALEKAAAALRENSPPSQSAAEESLAAAAKAIDEQLARIAAADESTPMQSAVALSQMAAEAKRLADALKTAEAQNSDTPPLGEQVESLQSRTAPVSPEAAASMADAAAKIESKDAASAAAAMEKSAEQLASQAQAAQAAAQEDASLASLEAAIEKASQENQAVGDALKSKTPGEAAGKALQSQSGLDQLAAQAALAAQMASANQPGSKETLKSTSQATSAAASEALRAAQAASRGDVASAKKSNAEASKSLSTASENLAQRREALRGQLGLPTSDQPSESSSPDGDDAGAETNQLIAGSGNLAPTPDGDANRGFSPEVRQAMGELRKTPVPAEYSGEVQTYFEKLAAE